MTQATTDMANAIAAMTDKSGKYLTFMLAKETYGLEILKVREIIGLMGITAVPQTPEYVKGVINLRGKVIPVMDLRLKFAMDEAEHTEETCIIVVQVGELEMGVIVDRVSEVLDIAAEDIEDAPQFGSDVDTRFILGMGKAGGRVSILLNIDKVVSTDELSTMAAVANEDASDEN